MIDRLKETGCFLVKELVIIYVLLLAISYIIFLLNSYLSLKKEVKYIFGKNKHACYLLASLFGVIAPLDSCSILPIFFSFIKAGIPVPAAFSFLLSSSMTNILCLILLFTVFDMTYILTYTVFGILLACILGFVIHKAKGDRITSTIEKQQLENGRIVFNRFADRLIYAKQESWSLFKDIWFQVFLGISIGAIIHGFVPVQILSKYSSEWYVIPLATLIAVPLFFNAAGAIPLVHVFIEKGLSIGAATSFLMAATGLSLAQCFILQKVLKWRLLFIYVLTLFLGFIAIGYIFDFIF